MKEEGQKEKALDKATTKLVFESPSSITDNDSICVKQQHIVQVIMLLSDNNKNLVYPSNNHLFNYEQILSQKVYTLCVNLKKF